MSTDCDKVISSLRYVNLQFDIHSYISKLFAQKTAFLAQTLGLSTNYPFNYYIHGPYSPQLTNDYYCNTAKFTTLETNYTLTENETAVMQKIKDCNLYESASLMEAASTIVFVATRRIPFLKDHEMFAAIKTDKPFLTDETVIIGMTKAKELLFRPEYLTQELTAEFKGLSNLSIGCHRKEETTI